MDIRPALENVPLRKRMDLSQPEFHRLEAEVNTRYAEFVGTPGPDIGPDKYRSLGMRQEIERKC